MANAKNTICIWYDTQAAEAAQFYASLFPDTVIHNTTYAPGDFPDTKTGAVLTVDMTIMGIPAILLNGGPMFQQSEAFSMQVETEDQEETDRYWYGIVNNGGAESMCGWCKDKWGVSWQITPRTLNEGMQAGGEESRRVFEAMLPMKRIDIAAIDAARRG